MQSVQQYALWAWAHREHAIAALATLVLLWRAAGEQRRAYVEQHWPRVAHALEAAAALVPDVWAMRSPLYGVLVGARKSGDRPTQVPPLPVLLFALVLAACSGSQARQQALIATGFGEASARALPVLVESYRQAQLRALPQCPSAARQGSQCPAVLAVRQQWAPLWTAWEGARLAHDRWSRVLMLCQSDPSAAECSQVLPAAEAAAFDAIQGARCTALALGERDLLSSLPLSCVADGGIRE